MLRYQVICIVEPSKDAQFEDKRKFVARLVFVQM